MALSLSESMTTSSSKTVVSGAVNGKQFHYSQGKVALAGSAKGAWVWSSRVDDMMVHNVTLKDHVVCAWLQ
jgi:hypothetical protein